MIVQNYQDQIKRRPKAGNGFCNSGSVESGSARGDSQLDHPAVERAAPHAEGLGRRVAVAAGFVESHQETGSITGIARGHHRGITTRRFLECQEAGPR